MACRKAYKTKIMKTEVAASVQTSATVSEVAKSVDRLLFGADSEIPANDLLQNNIKEFEWVVRNKIYPIWSKKGRPRDIGSNTRKYC